MTAATGTWSKASKRRATDRSTALARAGGVIARVAIATSSATPRFHGAALTGGWGEPIATLTDGTLGRRLQAGSRDRKSTRLNSSHSQISYAVFCLKKKKIN